MRQSYVDILENLLFFKEGYSETACIVFNVPSLNEKIWQKPDSWEDIEGMIPAPEIELVSMKQSASSQESRNHSRYFKQREV